MSRAHTHTHTQCETEAILMEYTQVQIDLVDTLNNLSDWMSPCHKPRDLLNKFNSVYVQPDPYGVVLSIVPWNYPMQIMLCSLIGIIAAGRVCSLLCTKSRASFCLLASHIVYPTVYTSSFIPGQQKLNGVFMLAFFL